MRNFTCLSFLFFFAFSQAQEVTIRDEATGEPLFNVTIFNRDKTESVVSDFDGKADISEFKATETLFFRHLSHLPLSLTKQEILKKGGEVLLERNENQLEEVVVSVAKFKQSKKDVPQKVVSFTKEDVILSSPQTSADLLENSGQVYVQKSQLGGGSPMVRGFSTNRLLLTVDGVRMNTAIFRGGNVQNVISIDPLAIENTEVVLGPGSVVFGSDAIGGVMNFFTLKPRFTYKEDTHISGRGYARYASANNEKTGHFDLSVGKKKWAFASSLSYSDFGDLRMGSQGPEEYLRQEYVVRRNGQDVTIPNEDPQVQKPTGYSQINLFEKILFKPNQQWDFSLGLIYSTTSNYPRYDRLYRKRDEEFRSAEWYYGPQRWLQGNLQANNKGSGNLYDEAKFGVAYQFFEESRNNRDYQDNWLFINKERVNAWSANMDFEKDFEDNKLYYGVEYVLNEVASSGTERNIENNEEVPGASRYPDGATWESLAAYGSFQWKLGSDLSLQTGARYNYILLNANFEDSGYDLPFEAANLETGALTGSAGLNWQQNELLTWKLNFSTAFRSPNIDDVGKIFDSAPGMVVVPNPNLKPEYAYNSELGVQLNLEEVLLIDLTGYYTHLDNALVRRDFDLAGREYVDYQGELSRVQAIQNAAHAFVYGLEAGAELRFTENLGLLAQISITEGKEEQEDGTTDALRHAAPLFGNIHFVWEGGKLTLDLFGEYNGEFSYEELAPTERDKPYMYAIDENGNPYSPEWYTLNFNSSYEFNESWLATLSLENITDQRYRTYSSGLAAPGRNFILAVQFSF